MAMLEGKVGLVTGGGTGLGRATAILAAREGSKVGVVEIRDQTARETVDRINEDGGEAIAIHADVTEESQVEAMVSSMVDRWGRLDWASNNAVTGAVFAPIHEFPGEAWQRTLSVDLMGVFLCMKWEIRAMLEMGGGSIINISSVSGHKGEPLQSAYSASKGGVDALTKTGAAEYAGRGIRINSVAPGGMATESIEHYFERVPKAREQATRAHAMGRLAAPREVAEAVVWLASNRASFVTGECLFADGGARVNSQLA
ncbi:glucose 1-dehydrogenase [Myxococcota bacterium]|nr:glucose 1-dehydrogenase [Myxococcota bacterium]